MLSSSSSSRSRSLRSMSFLPVCSAMKRSVALTTPRRELSCTAVSDETTTCRIHGSGDVRQRRCCRTVRSIRSITPYFSSSSSVDGSASRGLKMPRRRSCISSRVWRGVRRRGSGMRPFSARRSARSRSLLGRRLRQPCSRRPTLSCSSLRERWSRPSSDASSTGTPADARSSALWLACSDATIPSGRAPWSVESVGSLSWRLRSARRTLRATPAQPASMAECITSTSRYCHMTEWLRAAVFCRSISSITP
mmetsp:Transcript_718/g.2238  ORF Transcript_718/g.2238 Transcript_718/m.2238 type:complete len:251 (-) Transcript_718:26-778(-)